MWRAVLVLSLLQLAPRTDQLQQHAMQHYFISRRARSDPAPVRAGYVYRQMNNGPPTIATFHSDYNTMNTGNAVTNGENSDINNLKEESTESRNETKTNKTSNQKFPASTESSITFSTENKLWPERDVTGTLKRAASGAASSYEAIFRNDDDDIRTAFKNSYDIWPFLYQNIYDYRPKIGNADVEKVKDKRYAISTVEKVIPVHEIHDDMPDENSAHKMNSGYYSKRTQEATTDNPIAGNQPFFSYVLNDYFDKTNVDDPTSFKGFSWGKEFDHEMGLQEIDDYSKEMRQMEKNIPLSNREEKKKETRMLKEHDAIHESSKNKGRDSHRDAESREKGNDINRSYDGTHQYDGENYKGFKDFADSFANRFGAEDHDRESSFAKKNNTDKGEKKKGFRTIYHKDEYQEHSDFFDNTNNSENAEEKGASKVRVGGSEAFLRSIAGAATAGEQNKIRNTGHVGENRYEISHEDKQRNSGLEREIDQYRDVAKQTALSNNADYVDRYII